MRTAMLGLLLSTTAACTPAGRTAVGGTVAGAGVLVTAAAVAGMAGLCPTTAEHPERRDCDKPTSPSVGLPIAAGGIGMAVLGGMIMAGSSRTSTNDVPRAESFTEPAPPAQPTLLAETDAVGMAVAWLMLAGIDGRKIKLLGVESKQSHLDVDGAHAELWNLRVHTAADSDWLRVGACYEFDGEWKVTSLGTGPCER